MACTNKFTPEADFTPSKGFTDYPPYLCPQTMFEPTYVTGYEDMALKVMDRMLLSQYENSPNLKEYMRAFIDEVNTLTDEIHKVELSRYIDNASHAQLDVIGVILQQTRNISIPKVWFGFQGASPIDGMADEDEPLAGGIFRSENESGLTAAEPLNDTQYRKILLCRGFVLNQATFDVNTVYKAIETALGRIPASIKLYEDTERNWILELDSAYTTDEEVGLLRAIQHWFIPMITNLDIRLRLIKKLVNGLPISDVFIYRTSDDDDFGDWVDTATTQSWYNEELNTTIRGKSKAFPEVALIVAEDLKITIYDATRTDLPMWMVFEGSNSVATMIKDAGDTSVVKAISMKNGKLYSQCGNDVSGYVLALSEIDFTADDAFGYSKSTDYTIYPTRCGTWSSNIANRGGNFWTGIADGRDILDLGKVTKALAVTSDGSMNNVAYMGSLDGLGRVASDGTVSRWTNNGDIFIVNSIGIVDGQVYWSTNVNTTQTRVLYQPTNVPLVETNINGVNIFNTSYDANWSSVVIAMNNGITSYPSVQGIADNNLATSVGLTKTYPNYTTWGNSMVANITKDWNTGILHGDIREALLVDTIAETVGVDETTDLVTDGVFDATCGVNWECGTDWSISGGQATMASTSIYNTLSQTLSDLVIGQRYAIEFDLIAVTNAVKVDISDSTESLYKFLTLGHHVHYFTATAITTTIRFARQSQPSSMTIDNVTVKKSGELILNGNWNYDTLEWVDASEAGAWLSWNGSGYLSLVSDGVGRSIAQQSFPTVVGKKYNVVCDMAFGTVNIKIGSTAGTNNLLSSTAPTGINIYTITATSTTSYLEFNYLGAGTKNIDKLEIRLAEADRSYKKDAISLFGSINKTPVATGAELVGYSGFSGYNFLQQGQNPDLDFGTDDFYIMGWFKTDSGGSNLETFVDKRDGSAGNLFRVNLENTGQLRFYAGLTGGLTTPATYFDDNWHFAVCTRGYIYIDGLLKISGSQPDSATSIGPLRIGIQTNGGNPADISKLALWRIGKGQPTATQIETIYNQESKMFEVDAKVTLQGSSNNIKAIDYDVHRQTVKACGLFHITTFKDLVVTEDEAVTGITSISTSNGGVLTGGTGGAYFES